MISWLLILLILTPMVAAVIVLLCMRVHLRKNVGDAIHPQDIEARLERTYERSVRNSNTLFRELEMLRRGRRDDGE